MIAGPHFYESAVFTYNYNARVLHGAVKFDHCYALFRININHFELMVAIASFEFTYEFLYQATMLGIWAVKHYYFHASIVALVDFSYSQ